MLEELRTYEAKNNQEKVDKALTLELLHTYKEKLYTRDCKAFHLASSGFVVNSDRTKGLFVLHNIYNTYSFPGGHADGNQNLFGVAKQEVLEETGLGTVTPMSFLPVAYDILPVKSHMKNSLFVPSHLHLSITYLFEANENDLLTVNKSENSQVLWLPLKEIDSYNMESYMIRLYKKVIAQLPNF